MPSDLSPAPLPPAPSADSPAVEVEAVASSVLDVITDMLASSAVTPSNVRNITGALKDIRDLRGAADGSTLVIRMEGNSEWAK